MNQLPKWLGCALSGFLLVACFPKLNLHPLVWVAALPLFLVLAGESNLWRAFGLAYLCGAIFFAGSCYWFVEVMRQYGGLSPGLALLALLFFVIVDSVFFGAFGWVMGWVARQSSGLALLASPFLWVAMELARTYLLTGFPWDLLGYGARAAGIRQIACVTGVYGLSFLAAATSAMGAWVILRWSPFPFLRRRPGSGGQGTKRAGQQPPGPLLTKEGETWPVLTLAGWIVLLLMANWALVPPPPAPGPNLAVLLQPDVPLEESQATAWAPWLNPSKLNQLVNMSLDALLANTDQGEIPPPRYAQGRNDSSPSVPGDLPTPGAPPLIIWAENPAPFYFTRDPIFRITVESMARRAQAYVVVNTVVPRTSGYSEITNSAIVVNPEGRPILQYDKIHLVPFGEYVPAWAFPGKIGKITSDVGTFIPGNSYRVAQTPEGAIGVFICYEDIFPQLVQRLTKAGAAVLVNISNDAWYGDSAAAFQHLEMARLRAIENRRYLLRATNDGITVVIDPYGRVVEQAPRHQALVLPAHFSYISHQTFYTRHGDVFAWLCGALGVAMALVGCFRLFMDRAIAKSQ